MLPTSEYAALGAWAATFHPFQREWLFDTADMAICNKSRQIGTSHTTSGVGVLWGAFHGELTTIISIGDRQSVEVLEKARKHALILQGLGSQWARFGRKDNDRELTFMSGGRILALPSSGGRSFTGNVFLDEYAYQEHASAVWDAAAPVTLLGYKMRVVSTPNGIGNDFYITWEKALEPDSGWSTHEIPIELAIAQGYKVDIKKCWRLAKGDPRIFNQMFRCSFIDNELQYIPSDAIEACSSDYSIDSLGPGEFYAGLDIGLEADLTVLIVVRLVKGVRYVVHVETMRRTDSDGLEAMVARAFDKWKLRRLCIDANGLGTFPAERIKKRHSERIDVAHRRPRVECLKFTPTEKETLATGLYGAVTGKTLVLPKTDASLPEGHWPLALTNGVVCKFNEAGIAVILGREIAAIRRIVTPAGNIRYDAPRTKDGHADRAWALALALHATSSPNRMLEALTNLPGMPTMQGAR